MARIASAQERRRASLIEASSGQVIKTMPGANAAVIKLLSLSPDNSTAAVYGADGTLGLWRLAAARIAVQPGVAGVRAMIWTRDGKAIYRW